MFIHSPADQHLGCFQLRAIRNKASMSIHLQAFLGMLLGPSKNFWSGTPGSQGKFMLTLLKNCQRSLL